MHQITAPDNVTMNGRVDTDAGTSFFRRSVAYTDSDQVAEHYRAAGYRVDTGNPPADWTQAEAQDHANRDSSGMAKYIDARRQRLNQSATAGTRTD